MKIPFDTYEQVFIPVISLMPLNLKALYATNVGLSADMCDVPDELAEIVVEILRDALRKNEREMHYA